jgi:hypothetical protein
VEAEADLDKLATVADGKIIKKEADSINCGSSS